MFLMIYSRSQAAFTMTGDAESGLTNMELTNLLAEEQVENYGEAGDEANPAILVVDNDAFAMLKSNFACESWSGKVQLAEIET